MATFGYERVYLPLCKVEDTPFHIQGDHVFLTHRVQNRSLPRCHWTRFAKNRSCWNDGLVDDRDDVEL